MAPRAESKTASDRRARLVAEMDRQKIEDQRHEWDGNMGTLFHRSDAGHEAVPDRSENGALFRDSQVWRSIVSDSSYSKNYGPNRAASTSPTRPRQPERDNLPTELSGPIPGQSLVSEPGAAPWERPPEINTPEEAAAYHLDRLNESERMQAATDALELGLTVVDLTKAVLRNAVAEGIHSIDVSLIVAPVIHEAIRGIADASGIEFEEGLPKEKDRTDILYQINQRKAQKMMDKIAGQPRTEEEPEISMEEEMPEDIGPPRGLMSPRGEM